VSGCRHQHGGVAVVPAGMHHAIVHAAVTKGVGFMDGQRVHVGPQAQTLVPAAAHQLRHQACSGQPARDGVAPAFQLLRNQGRGAKLLQAQLWMAVQVLAQGHKGTGL
jgi:hypothetical protein